ncbi:excinuclease ABC subunit UvrC [Marinoscillum furvescens]|uniref:UvrABC system protein C n=1 Tax=Marinoscillum furvescens DSM 4134 TaxID=1122208 RepID=A0A3D9L697_MARFU|nr:excinuclease ABC subunit UvrC [Marinoscillum furvescens]REE00498.1 excinuclease ABC subunit C [Marinoscillum furvescens DSM 4134]
MQSFKFTPNSYRDLPNQPGVYKFYDTTNTIIYVGKAKSLAKRVSSYFTKAGTQNRKTVKLVREIESIEIVIVNSEFDALLLENSLIKEHQPKYNILLKDDKTFPSICITNERFPRVFATRQIDRSQGTYFGPYTSVKAMNSVLDLLRKLYTLRTCNLNLSPGNIQSGKFKVCLEYHIGNCLGPCEGLQSEEDYQKDIDQVRHILKGNIGIVKSNFKDMMADAASQLKFELAQSYKDKLELLDKFQSKSTIVNPKINNMDIIGVNSDEHKYYINYMKVEQGSIRVSETIEAKRKLEEPEAELLQLLVFNLRKKFGSLAREIVSNRDIETWDQIELTHPKIGDKKKLLDLSLKNALYFKNEKQRLKEQSKSSTQKVMEQLQSDLGLKSLPKHIECFDNSNIQGTNPVSSMVCFKNAKPSKKDYRKYHIKTVEGPNDFASMTEVVGRRYRHLKEENLDYPDLVIIDGGKGQLSAACEALKNLELYGEIPIIGIAKRLEEIYFPEDSIPVHISKKSPSLKLLQHLRDEAHRFAITFHRQTRSKAATQSELDQAPGIGPTSRDKLLQHFKSIKRLKTASLEEIQRIIGQSKGQALHKYLNEKRDQN